MSAADRSKLRTEPFKDLYTVGPVVGEGGFGIVKLITSKKTGEKLAVKIIRKDQIDEGDATLRNEIDVLTRVEHENCVGLLEWFDEDGKVLLVMELLTGGVLLDRIVASGKYCEADARKAFYQLVHGLVYLHQLGIAHRDLKPENFLLKDPRPDSVVKIADFGLSRIFLDNSISRTICGTPAYVAPEVIMCMEGTRRNYDPFLADTWSLGCNFYILLCGHSAFWPYEDNDAALFKAIKGGVIDWSALDKQQNVSAAAKGIVRMMLVNDPQHRAKVDQLALHPWVTGELAASTKQMPETLDALRKFVATRRWKRAGIVALAKGRFQAIAALTNAGALRRAAAAQAEGGAAAAAAGSPPAAAPAATPAIQ